MVEKLRDLKEKGFSVALVTESDYLSITVKHDKTRLANEKPVKLDDVVNDDVLKAVIEEIYKGLLESLLNTTSELKKEIEELKKLEK